MFWFCRVGVLSRLVRPVVSPLCHGYHQCPGRGFPSSACPWVSVSVFCRFSGGAGQCRLGGGWRVGRCFCVGRFGRDPHPVFFVSRPCAGRCTSPALMCPLCPHTHVHVRLHVYIYISYLYMHARNACNCPSLVRIVLRSGGSVSVCRSASQARHCSSPTNSAVQFFVPTVKIHWLPCEDRWFACSCNAGSEVPHKLCT